MREAVLPNFFIVGTGKAGTTSLYHYLRQHPQIYMSPIKEPCYFAEEIDETNLTESHLRFMRRMSKERIGRLADGRPVRPPGWLIKEWVDYLRLFQDAHDETAIGEASVVYLWSETAARNIAARIPGAKIVIMLRDPADRAFSQYLHQLTMGLTRSTFREHLEKCLRNRDRKLSAYYPLLEVGLYSAQVQRYFERFPKEKIRIYLYEDAWKEPRWFLQDVFRFLDVNDTFCPDLSRKSLEGRAPRFAAINYAAKRFDTVHRVKGWLPPGLRPAMRQLLFRRNTRMDPQDRQFLVDYYRDDIATLARMLERDLSMWLH